MATSLREWIREHDDRLSFVVLYIGGAIALSIWLNLFWVIVLMLAHFVLEIVRGRLLGARQPLAHALWEVKLDIALVLFAIVVALYSEQVLAALGLGQAARAGQAARGVQAVARFAIVERALRILVLTMDDMARLVQAAIKFRSKAAGSAAPAAAAAAGSRADDGNGAAAAARLETGDVLSLGFGALCLVAILLVPALTGTPPADVGEQILQEVSPYK